MLAIKSLSDIPFDDIATVFNKSFSDYYFPIHYTAEMFENKIKSENGILELSVGAYEDNELIGFIMHYYDEIVGQKVIYNGGTGVVPSSRGQGLTRKMYDYILPILRGRNIDMMIHEVLTVNASAISVYEKVGFKKTRTLNCFSGKISIGNLTTPYEIRALDHYDWDTLQSFWDYEPTWQNSILTLSYLKTKNVSIGIYLDSKIVGYLIYSPTNNRIRQFAIHKDHRRKGAASLLIDAMNEKCLGASISLINVDSRMSAMNAFLQSCGMERTIQQYEMELYLH